jgi:hypothetical protein
MDAAEERKGEAGSILIPCKSIERREMAQLTHKRCGLISIK